MALQSEEWLREAEKIVGRLREELEELGVVLPSLRVDPVTAATREPYPLVELGRCNLNTAKRLADALHEARQ